MNPEVLTAWVAVAQIVGAVAPLLIALTQARTPRLPEPPPSPVRQARTRKSFRR